MLPMSVQGLVVGVRAGMPVKTHVLEHQVDEVLDDEP
jgi:hypothetical protein